MPEPPVRVFIVGSVRLYREGLADLLGRSDRVVVAGVARDRYQALAGLRQTRPDIALLGMPMDDSLAIGRAISQEMPDVKVVALEVTEDEIDVLSLVEAGFSGYVSRDGTLAGSSTPSPALRTGARRRLRDVERESVVDARQGEHHAEYEQREADVAPQHTLVSRFSPSRLDLARHDCRRGALTAGNMWGTSCRSRTANCANRCKRGPRANACKT
jgi:DNA-binding NarL/FixJ family response regulator